MLINDNLKAIPQHSVSLIPPGILHREISEENVDLIWLGFTLNFDRELEHGNILQCVSEKLADDLLEIWKMLLHIHKQIGLELEGKLLTVLGKLIRMQHETSLEIYSELAPLIDRLQSNPAENLSVPEMLSLCKMSKGTFFRKFHKLTGMTPVNFQLSGKMRMAQMYLLETDLSATQIAKLCGFNESFYFNRVFKRYFGVPPLEFRHRKPQHT